MTADDVESPDHTEEPPPILGSWRNVYAGVIGVLVVLILLFYWLTERYS